MKPIGAAEELPNDSHEERSGSVLTATITASSEAEAREKAKALETELQTGMSKEQLRGKQENDSGE